VEEEADQMNKIAPKLVMVFGVDFGTEEDAWWWIEHLRSKGIDAKPCLVPDRLDDGSDRGVMWS
jgi:hypothetical protein